MFQNSTELAVKSDKLWMPYNSDKTAVNSGSVLKENEPAAKSQKFSLIQKQTSSHIWLKNLSIVLMFQDSSELAVNSDNIWFFKHQTNQQSRLIGFEF